MVVNCYISRYLGGREIKRETVCVKREGAEGEEEREGEGREGRIERQTEREMRGVGWGVGGRERVRE